MMKTLADFTTGRGYESIKNYPDAPPVQLTGRTLKFWKKGKSIRVVIYRPDGMVEGIFQKEEEIWRRLA